MLYQLHLKPDDTYQLVKQQACLLASDKTEVMCGHVWDFCLIVFIKFAFF